MTFWVGLKIIHIIISGILRANYLIDNYNLFDTIEFIIYCSQLITFYSIYYFLIILSLILIHSFVSFFRYCWHYSSLFLFGLSRSLVYSVNLIFLLLFLFLRSIQSLFFPVDSFWRFSWFSFHGVVRNG